jgi:hypothetical protein
MTDYKSKYNKYLKKYQEKFGGSEPADYPLPLAPAAPFYRQEIERLKSGQIYQRLEREADILLTRFYQTVSSDEEIKEQIFGKFLRSREDFDLEMINPSLYRHKDSINKFFDVPQKKKYLKDFYYYEICSELFRMKAAKNRTERPNKKEVYLIMQNQHDDDGTFAVTPIIYKQLLDVSKATNTELRIYHTLDFNPTLKRELEIGGAKVNDSLNDINQYFQIFEELHRENYKISFLYLSAHGGYISETAPNDTFYGHFKKELRGYRRGDSLKLESFKKIFQICKDLSLLSIDCQVVLNSCYLGQTRFHNTPIEETTEISAGEHAARILENNIVLAARNAINSGTFVQEIILDTKNNRLIFSGNIPGFDNRFYGYCYTAQFNLNFIQSTLFFFLNKELASNPESIKIFNYINYNLLNGVRFEELESKLKSSSNIDTIMAILMDSLPKWKKIRIMGSSEIKYFNIFTMDQSPIKPYEYDRYSREEKALVKKIFQNLLNESRS